MGRQHRRWGDGGRRGALPPALILAIAGLAAFPPSVFPHPTGSATIHPIGPSSTGSIAPHAAACNRTAPNASDPTGEHGLFVLEPPLRPQGSYWADMNRYLVSNPIVCGADFWVHWSDIDGGPTATTRYNWTLVDQVTAPWVKAGKVVNLIFWAVGYGRGATYVPSYVLSSVPTIQCLGSPVTPVFWNSTYVKDYRAFVRATVQHFNNNTSVGYLRFGYGTGGETLPLIDADAPVCLAKLLLAGYSVGVWDSYIFGMLDYTKSLPSTHPFLVALDGAPGPKSDDTYADIAGRATHDGIGFGTEALVNSSATWNTTTGGPSCLGMGFCWLFNKFQGKVPLEVQTIGPSSPNGSGPVGSLVPLLAYSLDEHAQIFEVYFSDWLIAFDPHYPLYSAYHAVYGPALKAVARVVG